MTNRKLLDPQPLRRLFPYFTDVANSSICFDGVGGTQVPTSVIRAISDHLTYNNGNKGGIFRRSVETDKVMDDTRQIIAEFLNASDPKEIILGDNFTNLTFRLSRAMKQTWAKGDEIVVSRLDHDANVSPWVRAAEDAGVTVRYLDIEEGNCQLTVPNLENILSAKTRLVAFCGASSSIGTRPDVKALTAAAKKSGALVYVDAVALAPHVSMDVQDWGADFVGFSAYKMFGPHIGALWGRRDLLETLPAYKIRPAPDTLPIKWLNGAQPYELAAGFKAAVEYIAHVGEENPSYKTLFNHFSGRQQSIHAGMAAIEAYEESLTWQFIKGVKDMSGFKVWGVDDIADKEQRLPPIAVSFASASSNSMAHYLADRGIDVWSRSAYSISLSERLGLEISDTTGSGPDKVGSFIRVSFNHYNTRQEVDRILNALDDFRTKDTTCTRSVFPK